MRSQISSIVPYFTLLLQCYASSFYDNPEQDPLLPASDVDDELHRKWDAEVGLSFGNVQLQSLQNEPF